MFYVRVRDGSSGEGVVNGGVIKDSVPEPLLFSLFVNDSAVTLRSFSVFFLDNVKVVKSSGRDALGSIKQGKI